MIRAPMAWARGSDAASASVAPSRSPRSTSTRTRSAIAYAISERSPTSAAMS